MPAVLSLIAALILALLLWVRLVSVREHERTAARRSLLAALVLPVPFLVVAWVPVRASLLSWTLIVLSLVPVLVFIIPTGWRRKTGKYEPLLFTAADASFTVVEELAALCEGTSEADRKVTDPESAIRCQGLPANHQ